MKIKDKKINKIVDVAESKCPTYTCYWPRSYPGIFVQGRGYYNADPKRWICGTREAHGCPTEVKYKDERCGR